ncbi:MAG: hypothetical protein HRT36_06440 [Alphaproteobacteria bacterium]|nr:hypothetical protein [Alphaproteobacteria bacterium]
MKFVPSIASVNRNTTNGAISFYRMLAKPLRRIKSVSIRSVLKGRTQRAGWRAYLWNSKKAGSGDEAWNIHGGYSAERADSGTDPQDQIRSPLLALNAAVNRLFPDGVCDRNLYLMFDNGYQPTAIAFMQACGTMEHQATIITTPRLICKQRSGK